MHFYTIFYKISQSQTDFLSVKLNISKLNSLSVDSFKHTDFDQSNIHTALLLMKSARCFYKNSQWQNLTQKLNISFFCEQYQPQETDHFSGPL